MDTTILQVPVDKVLRNRASNAASKMGFSSLQEVVRVLMAKLAEGNLEVTFREPVRLSTRAVKRYNKMIDDVEGGKVGVKAFNSVVDLVQDLNGEN